MTNRERERETERQRERERHSHPKENYKSLMASNCCERIA